MTQKIFWDNPYQTQLTTHVQSVNGNQLTFEQTIIYALSGGQESDRGYINNIPVLEAIKSNQEIIYTLPDQHGLQTGDKVTMQIDWERRYRLMRLHFAAEVVLEQVYRMVDGIKKIGAHIAEDKARIDFLFTQNIAHLFPRINQQVSELVEQNQAIISSFSDEAQQRRYWEVEGFARVPCGGTHLKSTAEVGEISLKRKNIGKQKERIEIYLLDANVIGPLQAVNITT